MKTISRQWWEKNCFMFSSHFQPLWILYRIFVFRLLNGMKYRHEKVLDCGITGYSRQNSENTHRNLFFVNIYFYSRSVNSVLFFRKKSLFIFSNFTNFNIYFSALSIPNSDFTPIINPQERKYTNSLMFRCSKILKHATGILQLMYFFWRSCYDNSR